MKIEQTEKADPANAVSTPTNNIQNGSGMIEAERGVTDTKPRAHANIVTTHDFDAHGNNIRIEIDHGDGHIHIKNTYAFDNAESCYFGRLFWFTVRSTVPGNAAQDKTTVRNSEFTFLSDGLSLSQAAQTDNALAVTTTSSRDPMGLTASTRIGSALTSKTHSVVNSTGCFRTKTTFNTPGRVDVATSRGDTRAKTIYNGLRPTNEFGAADQTLKRVYFTPSAGGVNLVEAITCDQLSHSTSASVAESGTVTVSYDHRANRTHRTPTSDFGNVGTYVSRIRLSQKNNPKSWCKPAYKTLEKEEFKVLKRLANLIFRWFVHCMICAEKTENEVPVPKIATSKQSCAGMIGYHYDI